MSSRILFDKRNNEIIKSQIKPVGSAPKPSFENLCVSAKVPEAKKQYMRTLITDKNILTKTAKEQFRIIDNAIFEKPKCEINLSSSQMTTASILTVNVEIIDALEGEFFSEVKMHINDVSFVIDLANNKGSKNIELTEPDNYQISCVDDRFISRQATVEVV